MYTGRCLKKLNSYEYLYFLYFDWGEEEGDCLESR